MASSTYDGIVESLDGLGTDEILLLLAELENRLRKRAKRGIKEMMASYPDGAGSRTDWVSELRKERDDPS